MPKKRTVGFKMTTSIMLSLIGIIVLWDIYAHYKLGPASTVTAVLVEWLSGQTLLNKLAVIGYYGWFSYITLLLIKKLSH